MDEVVNLIAQRDELLREMCDAPLWVNGSVVETTRKVRGKEMTFRYLSHSIKGENKITYISEAHLKQFQAAAVEGDKIKRLQNELSAINMKLI
ncbi:MAG: hypothetical protein V3V05_00910, partial [Pontiella sp.]